MSSQPAPPVAPIPVMQPQPIQPIRQPIINNPVSIPNQQLPNQPEDETEQQKALLMKVLQLTDDQINALPPQTRDQIRQLVNTKSRVILYVQM
jgi:cleavage stimulation factor subunit 2